MGETEFQIRKRWEPALEEGAEGSIVVQLYRDGVAYAPAKNVILPEGAERNADGTLTLTGGGDGAAWLLKGLPKYDSVGVKYIYTAREIACMPSVYRLADQYYTTEELCVELKNGVEVIHDVITCVFTNAHEGGGRILTFEVEKKWLDDNDLLHRGAVTVQLYYVKQGAGDVAECVAVEDATVVLDSRNQWFSMLYHMPSVAYDSDSPEWDVSNYFLREISISDSGAEGSQARVEYTGSELQGKCTATEHIYAVSNEYEILDQHSAAVTVTNLRKGTVNMEITKAWNVGGMKQIDKEDMTAWFTVYQNDREFRTVPMSITGNGNTLYIRDLPKYDEYGALYSYTLQESGLNNLEFEDGVIDWSDFWIVSSGSVREYEAGEHHTNDWMRASFTNPRVASSEIIVNKVWRDDGTDAVYEKRPDIVLTLYRQSVDEDGHPLKDASGAEIEPELGDGLETRYAQTTVYGMADSRWMVDLRHLAVGVPGTQHGAYSENGAAVLLNVQADGSFAAEVALTLAGCIETLTISGRVEVLKRDSYGNPRQISLTVNGLPANLDVGILFTAVRIPSDIPQTGDMLAAALAIGGICLAALILLAVLHRKRHS